MRGQAPEERVRCPDCNDQWLAGKLICTHCSRPLRVRRSELLEWQGASPPPTSRGPSPAAPRRDALGGENTAATRRLRWR